MGITVDGKNESYEVVKVFEFDSDRKMMSVVVKDAAGKLKLFIKGADGSMIPRLSKTDQGTQTATLHFVEEFAKKGLRTLVFGVRDLSGFNEAAILNNEIVAVDLEKDIRLLGVSGVEDLL
jgi:P-type E1-E2 ATPase